MLSTLSTFSIVVALGLQCVACYYLGKSQVYNEWTLSNLKKLKETIKGSK